VFIFCCLAHIWFLPHWYILPAVFIFCCLAHTWFLPHWYILPAVFRFCCLAHTWFLPYWYILPAVFRFCTGHICSLLIFHLQIGLTVDKKATFNLCNGDLMMCIINWLSLTSFYDKSVVIFWMICTCTSCNCKCFCLIRHQYHETCNRL
jgi:hypothetical protein